MVKEAKTTSMVEMRMPVRGKMNHTCWILTNPVASIIVKVAAASVTSIRGRRYSFILFSKDGCSCEGLR